MWILKAGLVSHARSHAAYHQFLSRCPIAFPRPRSPVLGGHVSAHDAACLNFDFRSAIPIRDVIRYGFNHLTVPGARPVPKPNTRQRHGPFAPRAVDGCGVEQLGWRRAEHTTPSAGRWRTGGVRVRGAPPRRVRRQTGFDGGDELSLFHSRLRATRRTERVSCTRRGARANGFERRRSAPCPR